LLVDAVSAELAVPPAAESVAVAEVSAVVEASLVGAIEGLSSMMTVLVDVAVRPVLSVTT